MTNQKGGVGKSATAANLSGALAEAGRSVLVVDLDPQGHLTTALGMAEADGAANLADALTGEWAGPAADLIAPHSTTEAGGRLDVLPTTLLMFTVARSLDRMRAREHRLSRVLRPFVEAYDHVLIDCPPALDVLTDNALAAADGIVVPVEAEDSSLRALRLLLSQVAAVDADLREQPLTIHGLVVSRLRRPPSTLARSVLDALDGLDLPVLGTVPLGVVVTEAWRMGRPVVATAPESEHAAVYRAIARALDPQVPAARAAADTEVTA